MVNCSKCGVDVGESKFCPNCGTEVAEEHNTTTCPSCGADVGESKFCPNCGTKIEDIEELNTTCPSCGADVGESKFCPECGTKIEMVEEINTICPNCGEDTGGSKFCPSCGTKMGVEEVKNTCPNCGKEIGSTAQFCPYCGFSENVEKSSVDKIIDVEESISGKFGKKLGKSKTMDALIDKTASMRRKEMVSADRKFYEKIEPVFLEVYDSIDDEYLKSIFFLERQKHDNQGGGLIGVVATKVNTPTKNMSHDEAIQYYGRIVNNLKVDINREKQNGTFDEDEFYKKKVKESTIENMTTITGLRYFKK